MQDRVGSMVKGFVVLAFAAAPLLTSVVADARPSRWYRDSDGDGFGNPVVWVERNRAPRGYVADGTDCNDGNAAVHPGAAEACNGTDDNCDGAVDEGVATLYYPDADQDGFGAAGGQVSACAQPAGYLVDNTDCDDQNATVNPGAVEACDNGTDDNCNGTVDEGVATLYYPDADQDGFGNPAAPFSACSAPSGHVTDSSDCNDNDALVRPGALEICGDGIDNNCDGNLQCTTFALSIGGTGNQTGQAVRQTSDGGYISLGWVHVGSYSDLYLLKTDAAGAVQWTRTYGGYNFENAADVQQTADGGYILFGDSRSFLPVQGIENLLLVKLDPQGNQLWQSVIGEGGVERAGEVQQTSDGGYILAGSSTSFSIIPNIEDIYLVKTNANGEMVWQKTFGPPGGHDRASAVKQTPDGGYIVGGSTQATGDWDVDLIRTDADGNLMWERIIPSGSTYSQPYDIANDLELTADGGFIVTGSAVMPSGSRDAMLIKTYGDGVVEWISFFGGAANDEGTAVKQTPDGGYIVAGTSSSYSGDSTGEVLLVKTDADGNAQWTRTVGRSDSQSANDVCLTSDGGYVTTGVYYYSGVGPNYDVFLVKTDDQGSVAQ